MLGVLVHGVRLCELGLVGVLLLVVDGGVILDGGQAWVGTGISLVLVVDVVGVGLILADVVPHGTDFSPELVTDSLLRLRLVQYFPLGR